jgi:2-succinyl-6-hydroxy-2,4-cyclohexadiene-1-carboxylate synthase
MTRILVNGAHLNVELSGAGPPLVLLHGFTGSITNWKPHIPIFDKRFQVIVVDLLGHGGSDSPADSMRYRMERCVEDLISVFDQFGLGRVNLLGYSLGGRVALHVAAAHPDRVHALVLESASPGLANPAERQARVASDEALADSIERDGLEAFVNRWEQSPLFASQTRLPASVRAELRAQRLHNNPHGLANSLRGLGTGAQPPLWDRLREIRVPTLLIAGMLDPKFTAIARAMTGALPFARLALAPDAGHTVHLEQPEVFDKLVMEFLEIGDWKPSPISNL